MSEPDSPRRVIAEIRFGTDRSVIAKVGSRSIHQYWHLLAPDFHSILLAPQRRPDEGGVAWTWRQAAENRPLTAAELAEVRERLTKANRSFAKNLPDSGSDGPGGRNPQESADQFRSKVDDIFTKLVGKSDDKLAAFVARTEAGPMLHSWGASAPAQPYYPDAHNCEVSGVVLVGDKDAADFEVVIESRKGVCLARTRSDASGAFHFEKIGSGTHRVRVISDRVDFPVNGVAITVERASVTNLELRSTSLNVASAITSSPAPPLSAAKMVAPAAAAARQALGIFARATPRRRWLMASSLVMVAVVVAGGGWWTWRWWHSGDLPAGQERGAFPTDVPPLAAGGAKGGPSSSPRLTRTPDTGRSADPVSGTLLPRSRAPSVPSSSPLAAASAKPPSAEPARGVGGSSKTQRESHELAPALDRRAASAEKDSTEGDLLAASPPPEEQAPAEETEDAPETVDPGAVSDAPASSEIHQSPKLARAAGGKTRKATPAGSNATARATAPVNGPATRLASASASRAATPASAASTQAGDQPKGAGVAPANATEPAEAADEVGFPEPGEGAAAPVAASEKPPAKAGRSAAGKSGSASPGSRAQSAQVPLAADGLSANPAPGAGRPAAGPARSNARKAGRGQSHEGSAPADAAPPAETPGADDSQDSDATVEVAEVSPPDQKPAMPAAATAAEARTLARAVAATPTDAPLPATTGAVNQAAAPGSASGKRTSAVPKGQSARTPDKSDQEPGADGGSQSEPYSCSCRSEFPPSLEATADRYSRPVLRRPGEGGCRGEIACKQAPTSLYRTVVGSCGNCRFCSMSPAEITAVPADAVNPPVPQLDAGNESEPGRLVRATQVRISAWAPRLVQDVILPTQPVRDGEDDTMELLRERLFQERRSQIPRTLKHPVIQFGFSLEIAAGGDGGGLQLRWRDATGKEPAGVTVNGQRAEISWSDGTPPHDVVLVRMCQSAAGPDKGEPTGRRFGTSGREIFRPGDPGYREIARITTDPQGGLVLEAAKDVSCRYWVAVERAAADEAGLPMRQGASRFDWRLLHGASLPSSWMRDDNWLGGRGQRLDLLVGGREGGTATCSLALVDRITGWAIVSEVSQAVAMQ